MPSDRVANVIIERAKRMRIRRAGVHWRATRLARHQETAAPPVHRLPFTLGMSNTHCHTPHNSLMDDATTHGARAVLAPRELI